MRPPRATPEQMEADFNAQVAMIAATDPQWAAVLQARRAIIMAFWDWKDTGDKESIRAEADFISSFVLSMADHAERSRDGR